MVKINEYFSDLYNENSPGFALAAVHNEKIIFQKNVGYANCEHKILNASNIVYNIGSVSKQFTGLAILQLIEKGMLKEDDALCKYIPELSHYADRVTIYHLANHQSGIIDYNDLLYLKARNNALYSTNNEVLQLLKACSSLKFIPGTKFEYSNSNYVLLAIIIERITNIDFKKYMKKNVFSVADLNNTFINNEDEPIIPKRAYGYTKGDNGWKCCYVDTLATGCANIYTSIEDMIIWDSALYSCKLLNQENMARIYSPAHDNDGNIIMDWCGGYSYGWMIQKRCGENCIYHTGGDAGFNSLYFRFYEKNVSIMLLSNMNNLDWNNAFKLVDDLFLAFIKEL